MSNRLDTVPSPAHPSFASALATDGSAMDAASSKSPRKSLRCRLGFHRWVGRRRTNGERYTVCYRCGRQDEHSPSDDAVWWSGGASQM